MSPVGIHFDAEYERHDTGAGHPESAHRYQVLAAALETLPEKFIRICGRAATSEEIGTVLPLVYQELVRRETAAGEDYLSTGDTAISPTSEDVARRAAGAVMAATDAVMKGEFRTAFCAVRPPGHHASASRGMGFCIYNHVAIAARHLQRQHGLRRIAIIDWDVHHGNGTEAIFLSDPDVLYISLHQEHIYPFTGAASTVGEGTGRGTTLNIPLPRGSDGTLALRKWSEQIDPAVEDFCPDILLISAGFDARTGDPIGGLAWDDATIGEMTRRCRRLADRSCGGRMVSSLEGGYSPAGLAAAALAHVQALAE